MLSFLPSSTSARRLRRLMRQGRYRVTFDRDFEGVIKACAGRRPGKWQVTWITPRIMHAYAELHDAGYAHSFEVWNSDGELVGGGYGVALGGAFITELQFARESQHVEDRLRGAQLAPGQMGLPAQRRQGGRPAITLEHGFPRGSAPGVPGPAHRRDARAGPHRPLAGRDRSAHARTGSRADQWRALDKSRTSPTRSTAPLRPGRRAPAAGGVPGARS